jgi:hypothetical protein
MLLLGDVTAVAQTVFAASPAVLLCVCQFGAAGAGRWC